MSTQTAPESEREMIFQDNGLLKDILKDLNNYYPLLRKVQNTYEALSLGSLTPQIFGEIKTGTDGIAARYRGELTHQLDAAGVKHPNLRKSALRGTEIPLQEFSQAVDELQRFRPPQRAASNIPLPLKSISYESGEFIVNGADREVILENHCRIYLETIGEKELFSALASLEKSYNEFHPLIEKLGVLTHSKSAFENFVTLDKYFSLKDGKAETKPFMVKWACSYKAFRERMEK